MGYEVPVLHNLVILKTSHWVEHEMAEVETEYCEVITLVVL